LPPDLELAVISAEPAIKDLGHLDLPFAEEKPDRRLSAATTHAALDTNDHGDPQDPCRTPWRLAFAIAPLGAGRPHSSRSQLTRMK